MLNQAVFVGKVTGIYLPPRPELDPEASIIIDISIPDEGHNSNNLSIFIESKAIKESLFDMSTTTLRIGTTIGFQTKVVSVDNFIKIVATKVTMLSTGK